MESQMIRLKLWVNRLAVICGSVSREMASTIPTIRRQETMVSAINIISRYSKAATGMRWERANSRSNAIATIGRRKSAKKTARTTLRMASNQMSLCVIVRIFPKRNDERSGVKPGARKLKMIPYRKSRIQQWLSLHACHSAC